ncbi:SLBB domain-containing protein [Xenococcus sp. PCC 7305]|uniref:SLBB domain-containing protein n=1 Tax=Xenococcus sp. PCC 7305 TaxID=102125 RepID=UPI001EE71E97|nr:SLBB domain-containing protein [Xenococcus sp. PCC 7305]
MNHNLYQLLLGITWKKLAIATPLLLVVPIATATAELEIAQTTPNANVSSGQNVIVAGQETDYTLGAGDQIRLDIFQVDEYSGEYPVNVDGTISLPLVGAVNVEGLTLKQTEEAVSKQYSVYLKRPIVNAGLVAPRPLKIGVSGEVDNPGAYEFQLTPTTPDFPTVTDMIEQAGGITTLADVRNVQVNRTIQGRTTTFTSDLWSLLNNGQLSQDISLRDGDTIFLPTVEEINLAELERLSEASFGLQVDEPISVAVVGEIYSPGSLVVQPDQLATNNNQNNNGPKRDSLPPRLTQAIELAGGIKPTADVRAVEVRRETWDGKKKVMTVNLWDLFQSADADKDVILQEGDEITVSKAVALSDAELQQQAEFGRLSRDITVNVVGEVANPGAIQVKPNTPLNQAILAAGGFDKSRANQGEVELVRLNLDGTVEKREIDVDLASGANDENNPILKENDVVVVGRSGLAATSDAFRPAAAPLGILRLIFGF